MCHYSPKEADRMRRGDFAFFAAISVPDATEHTLRTVTDWLNWVCFPSLPLRNSKWFCIGITLAPLLTSIIGLCFR